MKILNLTHTHTHSLADVLIYQIQQKVNIVSGNQYTGKKKGEKIEPVLHLNLDKKN